MNSSKKQLTVLLNMEKFCFIYGCKCQSVHHSNDIFIGQEKNNLHATGVE